MLRDAVLQLRYSGTADAQRFLSQGKAVLNEALMRIELENR
jgi:hypothetical protein